MILPDSESVDESLDGDEKKSVEEPAAEEEKPDEPAQPKWSIRWQNAFIV